MKKKTGKFQNKRVSSSSACGEEYRRVSTRAKSDSCINLFDQLSQALLPPYRCFPDSYIKQAYSINESTSKMSAKNKKKEGAGKGAGKKGKGKGGGGGGHAAKIVSEKVFADYPLADLAVLNQIKDAEQRAKQAAAQIAKMRDQIQALTKKDELSPAEMEELQKKQKDIVCKLAEFEDVTKKIQELVGLASITCKDVPGDSKGGGGKTGIDALPDLPRVVIPPLSQTAQVAQVMVCEKKVTIEPMAGVPPGGPGWFHPIAGPSGMQQTVVGGPTPGGGPPFQGGVPTNKGQDNQPLPRGAGYYGGQGEKWFEPTTQDCGPPPDPQQFQQDCAPNLVEQLTDKLDASYKIQEKLALENKDMECQRYQLQEELLTRDKQTDQICKQLESLQCEMKLITAENCDLKKQVKDLSEQPKADPCPEQQMTPQLPPLCKMSLSKDPICKMDLYKQMGLPLPGYEGPYPGVATMPTKNAQMGDMEQVVGTMEEEVRAMQKELNAVQAERRSLDLQKKLLKCAAPRQNTNFPVCKKQVAIAASTGSAPQLELPKPPTPPPCPPPRPAPQCMREMETQLKELSQQYNQLNQDFNDKVAEISVLRVEADKSREEKKLLLQRKDEDSTRMDNLLTRIKVLEEEKDKWSGTKGVMLDIEQQMIMFKQKYIEKQEMEDEMKILINEQSRQLEEYRNKYIKAQEIVEGQRRDMDLMQKNHLRFSEQLTKELKTAKEEFQKRLEELSRLPDILKTTQQKLQESQQMRIIAEQNVEQLTAAVEELREKLDIVQRELENVHLAQGDDQMKEGEEDCAKLKLIVSELEEKVLEAERQLEGKRQHVVMLEGQVETLREESARAVTRTKERCDVVRRGLQNQISDIEVQLAQARASARSAQKDRDMIREKMECQVSKLTKNFEEAQNWIRCLQSHVGFLKTSNRDLEFASQPVECIPKAFQPIPID